MRSAVCYLFTTDELFSNQNWFLIEFITCANHWALQAVRLLEIIVNFINYGLGGGGGGGVGGNMTSQVVKKFPLPHEFHQLK